MANAIVAPWVADGVVLDKPTLVLITGTGFLFWTVMLSQALESITRAYYARADLDLILSSPASSRQLFAVRTGITALTTLLLACLLASPIVNVLILHDGAHWLTAYLVLAALSALSTAIAVLITIALFRLAGPKRTRLIAQIIAAVVGAGFVIGIQAVAILHFGNMNRFALFSDADFVASMPALDSLVWAPARAALGDWVALLGTAIVGFAALAGTIALASSSFGRHAIAAAGISAQRQVQHHGAVNFRPRSQKQQLRVKEWKLLARDPWLLSQTLMQILYLVPPALYLWISYGQTAGTYVVVIPVLVMAAGQLSGGLSWLAISGEDAHDLVVTAPVSPNARAAGQDRSGRRRHRHRLHAHRHPDVVRLLRTRGDHRRLRRPLLRLGDCHPALVPRADAPRHVPPPPGRLARLDHRRSAELDLLGRHRRARRRRSILDCTIAGRARRRDAVRRLEPQPQGQARLALAPLVPLAQPGQRRRPISRRRTMSASARSGEIAEIQPRSNTVACSRICAPSSAPAAVPR